MPRNSKSGSEPGEEIATILPLRSASDLISALARTTCGTPGQPQPTIFTPVPRAPATIDSAAPMSTLSISPESSAFINVAPALICRSSIFNPRFAAKPPLSTMAMKPASLLASRMPCFQTFSCACALVRPTTSAMEAIVNVLRTDESSCFDGFIWLEATSPRIRVQQALNSVLPAALAACVDTEKQLIERRTFLDQPLLVRIADQRLEHLAVLFREAVFPRIGSEHALLLFPGVAVPGERHNAWIRHALHRDRLCFIECSEQVHGEPRMLVRQRLPQPKHVHDRENSGALKIGHLFRLVIRKETRHARISGEKRLDEIGMKHRVELPLGQHGLDRFIIRQTGIFDVRR